MSKRYREVSATKWVIEAAENAVTYVLDMTMEDVLHPSRKKEYVEARRLYFALLHIEVGLTPTEISRMIDKDRSTIHISIYEHTHRMRSKSMAQRLYRDKYEACVRHFRYQIQPNYFPHNHYQ
jgi:chromosomal replication initiation ATPase DnaA